MNFTQWDFSEILRVILTMSVTGSVIALFLFSIKPLIRRRLPQTFQYYMWFAAYLALLLPLSGIDGLLEFSVRNSPMAYVTPVYDMMERMSHAVLDKPAALPPLYQAEAIPDDLKAQGIFPSMAAIVFFIWLLGALAFLSYSFICYFLFVRKLRKCNLCADPCEIEQLRELCGRGRRFPDLYRSPIVSTPLLIGIFHPMIIIPDEKYTEIELQNILLHELTHLQKHDVIVKWISVFASALHWYNPIVHLVRRETDRACEPACDEVVVKRFSTEQRISYGNTLLSVISGKSVKGKMSTAMCEDKKILRERLDVIMRQQNFSKKAIVLSSACLLAALCCTVFLCTARRTESAAVLSYGEEAVSSWERQRNLAADKLKTDLLGFDEAFSNVSVLLEGSESEITYANICVMISDEITQNEKENILSFVSDQLALAPESIGIDYVVLTPAPHQG